MADYVATTSTLGNLVGICPKCATLMYRRVSAAKLELVKGRLVITPSQSQRHIAETAGPSVNRDFEKGAGHHANAQP